MSSLPRKSAYGPRGFTLVELVVVITIIAILAGAIVPTIVKPFMHERRTETIREMEAIEEAILGRPDLGDWGYLSTIGGLPTSIEQLLKKPDSWMAADYRNGVPRGWNGPYVQIATQHPALDAWGEPYVIDTNTSDPTLWRLRSTGPNRVFGPLGPTNDDIIFPSDTGWYGSTGTVNVTMVVARGNTTGIIDPAWVELAQLHVSANNGASDAQRSCGGGSPGQCVFDNVPIGLHVMEIRQSTVTGCTAGVDCTIFRPVTAIKPTNAVEVVLPRPTANFEISCALGNFSAASAGNDAHCTNNASVPPGGRLTVTVSGALRRVSGSGRCLLAAQLLDVNTAGRTPATALAPVSQAISLPVASQSTGLAPAFTTRTFVNNGTLAVTVRPGAVLAPDPTATCEFTDGKVVAHRLGPP